MRKFSLRFFSLICLAGLVICTLGHLANSFGQSEATSLENDVFKFRGISIGIPINDQMPVLKDYRKNKNDKSMYCRRTTDDVGWIYNAPKIGIGEPNYYGLQCTITDDKVAGIYMLNVEDENANSFYKTFCDLMAQKYSDPGSTVVAEVQNGLGSKFAKYTTTWEIKNATIQVTNIYQKINQALITVTWNRYLESVNSEKQKENSKALDNL